MDRNIFTGGLTALVMGISVPAFAADTPSWNYLSLELVASGDIEAPGLSEDINGYRLDATKGMGDYLFVRAATNTYHYEQVTSFDFSTQQLGVGGHFPISAGFMTIDLWGAVNYERVSIEGVVGTGPGVEVGARAMLTPAFELSLSGKVLGDIDFDVIDADYTGYTLAAALNVTPSVAIQGSYNNYELEPEGGGTTLDYSDIIGIGVRMTY